MGKRLLRATAAATGRWGWRRFHARLEAVGVAVADIRLREGLQARRWTVCSTWSGCWGGWRWIRRGRGIWWRSAATLGRVCPGCVKALVRQLASGAKWAGKFRAFHPGSQKRDLGHPEFVGGPAGLDPLEDLCELIVGTIVDEPPVTFADGGVVRAGIHAELDELRELQPERAAGAGGD